MNFLSKLKNKLKFSEKFTKNFSFHIPKKDWKETLVTSGVILGCILSFYFIPTQGLSQKFTSLIIFFFLLPFLYLLFILRRHPRTFGLQLGDWKWGLGLAGVSLLLSLGIMVLLFYKTELVASYSISQAIRAHFSYFLFYEFVLIDLFLLLYLFFFQGLILFAFSQKIGIWSILLSNFLFFLFFLWPSHFDWKYSLFSLALFFSSIISYKSKSLLYSWVFSLLFILLSDVFVIKFLVE